jgi:hypothetical protein
MKFVFGCLLTAAACFGWGLLSWSVLDWHMNTIHGFEDQEEVAEVIKANVDRGHGVYVLPSMDGPSSLATPNEKKKFLEMQDEARNEGPYIYATVRPGIREWSMNQAIIQSVVRGLLAAILLAIVLNQTRLPYVGRVTLCAVLGLFAGIVCHMPDWIWFEMPTRVLVVNLADHLIEWTVAGAVLSAFVGKDPTAADVG